MTAELPWVQHSASGLTMHVDVVVYPIEVVLRACHTFTNRCYVFPRTVGEGTVAIDFVPRDSSQTSLCELAGAFTNILLDFRLRDIIAAETSAIRELLVTQAFCEADLLDRRQSESDEYGDPRGIVR
jgi:His-Xaa-Ser system protein HxsD